MRQVLFNNHMNALNEVSFTYAGYAKLGSGVGKNPAAARSAVCTKINMMKKLVRNFFLKLVFVFYYFVSQKKKSSNLQTNTESEKQKKIVFKTIRENIFQLA